MEKHEVSWSAAVDRETLALRHDLSDTESGWDFSQEELDKIGQLGLAYAIKTTVNLSAVQCSLLRFSWQHVGKHGPSGIGEMIFRRIFKKQPECRKMFPFGQLGASEIANHESFDQYSSRFVNVIDSTVQNVENLGNYIPKLIRYGMRHAHLKAKGFRPEWWDVFAEAMTESAIEWTGSSSRHRETIRAWTILMSYIVDNMRFGYDVEMKSIRRMSIVGGSK